MYILIFSYIDFGSFSSKTYIRLSNMVCCAELYANVEYVELDDEIDLIADNFIFEEEELELFDPRRLLHILPPIPGEQEEFEWEEVEEEVEEEFEEEVEEEEDPDVVQYRQTKWLSNIFI